MERMKTMMAWVGFAMVAMLFFPLVASAQEAAGPALEIPYIGQIVALIVAIFGLVSAIIPDSKMPPIVAQIVNFLALNFGNAKNDPN